MVDFRILGKDGLIIQYEDIISLIGYNIITYFKSKGINNEKIMRMSNDDILVSYINRLEYDPSEWIKNTFGLECNINDYVESDVAYKPNNLYAYKMFGYSHKEKIKNLMIYSERYSPIVEKAVSTFNVPELKYVYGDLVPILNKYPNVTFTTSSPISIRECMKVQSPILIVAVDDFLYLSDIIEKGVFDELRGTNKLVMFTSIMDNKI